MGQLAKRQAAPAVVLAFLMLLVAICFCLERVLLARAAAEARRAARRQVLLERLMQLK